MQKKIGFYIVVICGFFYNCYSQFQNEKIIIEGILSKSSENYSKEKYLQIDLQYSFYPDYSDDKSKVNYSGSFIKVDRDSYIKVANSEFVSCKGKYIKVDNDEKIIQMGITTEQAEYNFTQLLGFLKFFEYFNVKTDSAKWIITMLTPKISFMPYSKMVFHIDKRSYRVLRQEMYYLTNVKNNGKSTFPMIAIDVTNQNTVVDKKLRKAVIIDRYITKKGDKTTPSSLYKNYTILQ